MSSPGQPDILSRMTRDFNLLFGSLAQERVFHQERINGLAEELESVERELKKPALTHNGPLQTSLFSRRNALKEQIRTLRREQP